MAITAPTTPPADGIAFGTPPSTASPTNFDLLADAFLARFPTFQTELNAQKANVYTNSVASYGNVLQTQADANTTVAAVVSTQAAVNAPLWVSGTSYVTGNLVWSPVNGRIYRRQNNGAGTTDPSADGANWLFVSPLMKQVTESRATAAISVGVLALDLVNGVTSAPLNANITSITFANNIASTTAVQCHTLEFVADGTARTVVWPNGNGTSTLLVNHVAGNAPVLTTTAGKRDTFFLKSVSLFLWECYIVGQST